MHIYYLTSCKNVSFRCAYNPITLKCERFWKTIVEHGHEGLRKWAFLKAMSYLSNSSSRGKTRNTVGRGNEEL